jgi:hypothetical protein
MKFFIDVVWFIEKGLNCGALEGGFLNPEPSEAEEAASGGRGSSNIQLLDYSWCTTAVRWLSSVACWSL